MLILEENEVTSMSKQGNDASTIGQWIGERIWGLVFLLSILILGALWLMNTQSPKSPTTYAECMIQKNAKVIETYPQQCMIDGKSFTSPINDVVLPESFDTPGEAYLCSEEGEDC